MIRVLPHTSKITPGSGLLAGCTALSLFPETRPLLHGTARIWFQVFKALDSKGANSLRQLVAYMRLSLQNGWCKLTQPVVSRCSLNVSLSRESFSEIGIGGGQSFRDSTTVGGACRNGRGCAQCVRLNCASSRRVQRM